MNTTTEQKSLISSIPQDTGNIIKDFLVETRVVVPLKINASCCNYYITKYKEGYKIDKVLSLVKFEKENKRMSDENKKRDIDMIQKTIKKHYPIFIDEQEDVREHIYNMFYDDYDPEDEDDEYNDPDETMCVSISISGSKTHCCVKDFRRKMNLYMKLIGKVYRKAKQSE